MFFFREIEKISVAVATVCMYFPNEVVISSRILFYKMLAITIASKRIHISG